MCLILGFRRINAIIRQITGPGIRRWYVFSEKHRKYSHTHYVRGGGDSLKRGENILSKRYTLYIPPVSPGKTCYPFCEIKPEVLSLPF